MRCALLRTTSRCCARAPRSRRSRRPPTRRSTRRRSRGRWSAASCRWPTSPRRAPAADAKIALAARRRRSAPARRSRVDRALASVATRRDRRRRGRRRQRPARARARDRRAGAASRARRDRRPRRHHARRRRARLAAGLAHVPEDRHHGGLVLDATVAENLALGRRDITGRFVIDRAAVARHAAAQIARARYPPRRAEHAIVRALSGGNQQKVVVARELSRPALAAVIAAQPTRGVDLGAVARIHGRLRAAAAAGAGVLVISADLDELLALCHRVVGCCAAASSASARARRYARARRARGARRADDRRGDVTPRPRRDAAPRACRPSRSRCWRRSRSGAR